VRSKVLMAMAVFWAVASCSLVEVHQRFSAASSGDHPDNEGSKHL
jgi:hypothetical protein